MSQIETWRISFKPITRTQDEVIIRYFKQHRLDTVNETFETYKQMGNALSNELGLSPHVVLQRAFQLNLVPFKTCAPWLLSHKKTGWRSDEIDCLIKHPTHNRKELARTLNRSLQSIYKQCHELKLNNGGDEYKWQAEELKILKMHKNTKSIDTLKGKLNRCSVVIKHQMLSLGLYITGEKVAFTGRPKKVKYKKEKSTHVFFN